MDQQGQCVACGGWIIQGALICQHCGARQADKRAREKLRICNVCMSVFTPSRATMNKLNLLALVIPPLLIWQLITDRGQGSGCTRCGQSKGVPLDTPAGRELLARAQGHRPPQ